MKDEQPHTARTIMARIVNEKIPGAKKWSVSKDFKVWIDGLSNDEFEVYLDRLRVLTRVLSDEESSAQDTPRPTGAFIAFGCYPPSEAESRERLARIGGEATAYYALALWRTMQLEELKSEFSGRPQR